MKKAIQKLSDIQNQESFHQNCLPQKARSSISSEDSLHNSYVKVCDSAKCKQLPAVGWHMISQFFLSQSCETQTADNENHEKIRRSKTMHRNGLSWLQNYSWSPRCWGDSKNMTPSLRHSSIAMIPSDQIEGAQQSARLSNSNHLLKILWVQTVEQFGKRPPAKCWHIAVHPHATNLDAPPPYRIDLWRELGSPQLPEEERRLVSMESRKGFPLQSLLQKYPRLRATKWPFGKKPSSPSSKS